MKRWTWLLVAIGLCVVACGDDDVVVTTVKTTAETRPAIRILALGDSYTIGESVDEAERWPNQLGGILRTNGYASVDVEIVARTGWTTAELDEGIDRADPQGPYDLVTLLIGVNNQFRGFDAEEYRIEFAGLLERAVDFSLGPVLVVSIPDWGVTPFGAGYDPPRIAAEIDLFNAIGREEATRIGVSFVDIAPISRSGELGLVAADGLHPSRLQYSLWAEEMLPVVLGLLRS